MRLSPLQVTDFLTSVRALPPLSEDPSSLDSVMAERATLTEQLVQRDFGVSITRDRAGVEALDQLLNAMHDATRLHGLAKWFQREPSRGSVESVCASLGVLFGEIYRSHLGGTWEFADFQGQRFLAVAAPGGHKYSPIQKVGKQFLNGQQDSILFMFGLPLKLAQAAERIAKLSPEERDVRRKRALEEVEKRKAAAARVRKGN